MLLSTLLTFFPFENEGAKHRKNGQIFNAQIRKHVWGLE